jgi:hypothetical protein
MASGGYVGSTRRISLGSFTRPPTRTGALGPFSFGAIGWGTVDVIPPMTSPITPPSSRPTPGIPPATPPHTIHVGYRSFVNLSFGTTVGAISLPWSVNALFTCGANYCRCGRGWRRWRSDEESRCELFHIKRVGEIEFSENRGNQQDRIDCQADEGIDQSRTALHVVEFQHGGLKPTFLRSCG